MIRPDRIDDMMEFGIGSSDWHVAYQDTVRQLRDHMMLAAEVQVIWSFIDSVEEPLFFDHGFR